MSTAPAHSALSDADYQRETATLLAHIEATADRWLQDDVIDIDTHRSGGLLELSAAAASITAGLQGSGATRATAANSSPRCRSTPACRAACGCSSD
jgi:hypothetical protein